MKVDYENKTVLELMSIHDEVFESQGHDATTVDYNELFCEWLYELIMEVKND